MGQELTSDARPSDGSQPEDYLGKSILGRGVVTEGFDGGALGLNEIRTRVEDASTLGFPLCKATALSCPFIHEAFCLSTLFCVTLPVSHCVTLL